MTTYFVSRHSGALDWAAEEGIQADQQVSHLDIERIQPSDVIIGTLPVNLISEICRRGGRYQHLALDLPPEWRGRDLTAEEMRQCGARLEEYHAGTTDQEPESTAPAIAVRITARPLNTLLREIEHFSSWDKPGDQLSRALAECRTGYPDQEKAIQQRIRRGEEAKQLLERCYKIGKKHGSQSAQAVDQLNQLQRRRPDLAHRANKQLKKGQSARDRGQESHRRKQAGLALSQVNPPSNRALAPQAPTPRPLQRQLPVAASDPNRHPNDLRGLNPAPEWTLLIDETGSVFDGAAANLQVDDRVLGRLVGLLLPQRHGLAPLPPGWHAVDQSIAEIDRVIQAILDAPVGVLGITVQQLPSAPVERWTFGVMRLIDLVLRLLPMDGPVTLTVQIEQRADFQRGMEWRAIAHDAILRLAQAYPERAARITCWIQVIHKLDSSYNGYVDALAFVWSAASEYSKDCLQRTGLNGTCFLPGDAATISRAWEWLDRGISLEGADWAILLAQPEAPQPDSLTHTILERLGQASRNGAVLWQRYLAHTLSYLESKAIDLRTLGRQVEWLEAWLPPGVTLPKPARLLWLTAKLARANHLGQTEQPWMHELRHLGDELLEENAHLVCRAELNLAVNATNCYDFDLATRLLDRWSTLPIAVPGLRYWAQVRSSLGQHAAFRGDNQQAVRCFDEALAAFKRLSNPEEGRREAIQTRNYRAIALMDDPATPDEAARQAVAAVAGPLAENVPRLAVSQADGDKYPHHLVLRWLVYRPEAAFRAAYVAKQEQWAVGEGHPWPLIQLYRALLLHPNDSLAASELVLEGFRQATAADQGPVVQLIGACCRAVAAAWGDPWSDAENLLGILENALPLARDRIAVVRRFLATSGTPTILLQEVLPFNFH